VDKAPEAQFSGTSADVRTRLTRALDELHRGAEAGPVLDAVQEDAEKSGTEAALAAAYGEVLDSASVRELPSSARLELYLQAAWLCGQHDALDATTLEAACLALDVAPADERALALAEPLLLEAEQYGELANRYAVAATSAGNEARAHKLLEHAIHMLAPIPAAAPAMLGLHDRLQQLAVPRDTDEALLAIAGDSAGERQAAFVKLGERWLADGRAREGLEQLGTLPSDIEGDAALDVLERLCDQAEDKQRLEQTLRRRVAQQKTELGRARALEKLARFQHEWQADKGAAADTFMAAARSYQAANEPDDAERSYEQLLDLAPDHIEAAASLVLLRARSGDFAGVAEAFGVVLRACDDNQRASELLLSVADDAERAGAADEFAELADNVQWRLSDEDRELSGRLLRASARLFVSAMRHDEAAELYRRMIAERPRREDLEAYQALIDSNPGGEWRRNQQRWLFEWQENHSSDRPTILLSWARFEEHDLGDPEAAKNVLERAAQLAPDRPEIWENLTRLRLADGDAAGGLLAAGELRRLGRDVDPSLLGLLLEQEPGTRWALDRVKLSLSTEGRWPELFELYERAIDAIPDPRERAELLDEAAIAARDVAQDRPRALAYWEQYSQLVPHDPRVDLALERLYDQAGEKLGLIRHLQRRRQAAPEEARGPLSRRIAQLALELGDLRLALGAIEELPTPATDETAALLEALLAQALDRAGSEPDANTTAQRAALLLREGYASCEKPADVARVLRAELLLKLDDKQRRSLLAELSRVCEKELADLEGAFAAERELFLGSQSERDRKRLEKLAKKLGRFRELVQSYVDAAQARPDLDERRTLLKRAADIARRRLQDGILTLGLYRQLFAQEPAGAVELYESLRADLPPGSEAFEALCALLQETARYEELAQVLHRECAQNPSAELQARLGWLQARELGDPRAAIATFLQAGDPRAAAAVFLAAAAPFGDEPSSAVELASSLAKLGEVDSALHVLRHQLGVYEQRYCSERKLVQLELVRVLDETGSEQQADAELSEAARRYPTDADVQRACASSAVKRKDWERAEQCYRTLLLLLLGSGAATTDMCRTTVYVELAAIKQQRLQPAEAADLIDSAFEAALDNVRELTALAQALVAHENWQPAERAVGELLKLAKDLPTAARALAGVARLTLGGRRPSEELMQAATQAACDAASRFAELSEPSEVSGLLLACMSLIPLEQARQLQRDEAARLLPADVLLARLEISRRLLETDEPGQRDEAFAELAQLVQLAQAPLAAWQLLLTEAIARADAELAVSAYDHLVGAGAPPDAAVAGDLCKLCVKAGKPDRAAAFLRLEADRERQPLKRAALLVEAAELLLDAGQSSAAHALAEEAHALDVSSAEPVLLLAKLAVASGAREPALAMLTAHAESKERRRGKGLARVLRMAADLRLERDELVEALALLAEAHQLDKTDLDTALLLGLLAIDLDRLETAASALRVLIAQRELGTREGVRARSLNLAQGYFQLARVEQHHGKKTNAKRMLLRALEEDPSLGPAQQLLGELSHA
jgi:hypothetical protein